MLRCPPRQARRRRPRISSAGWRPRARARPPPELRRSAVARHVAPLLEQEIGLSDQGYGSVVAAFSMRLRRLRTSRRAVHRPRGAERRHLLGRDALVSGRRRHQVQRRLGACWPAARRSATAEGGGIPATAKGFALYLGRRAGDRHGTLNQVGITLGMVAAPLLVGWLATAYGWRSAFVASGLVGLASLPLSWLTARLVPVPTPTGDQAVRVIARADWRLWVSRPRTS